jgi:SAM-dependent methyltransferase
MVSCNCCQTDRPAALLFEKGGCTLYRCGDCGAGFAVPGSFDAESYYDRSYFDGSRADGYADYSAARDVLYAQFDRELDFMSRFPHPPGALLEVGCAYGYFLDRARLRYPEVYGIELAAAAVEECHRRGLTRVHQAALSPAALADLPDFGVVVMLDVIEHLPDPHGALSAVAAKMKQGALLFVTTGDFSSLAARLSGRHWRLMPPPQHLWFFTPGSIARLAGRAGLEVVAISHPSKKVPLGLMAFQALRPLGVRPRLPEFMHRIGVGVNLFDAMRVVLRKI